METRINSHLTKISRIWWNPFKFSYTEITIATTPAEHGFSGKNQKRKIHAFNLRNLFPHKTLQKKSNRWELCRRGQRMGDFFILKIITQQNKNMLGKLWFLHYDVLCVYIGKKMLEKVIGKGEIYKRGLKQKHYEKWHWRIHEREMQPSNCPINKRL